MGRKIERTEAALLRNSCQLKRNREPFKTWSLACQREPVNQAHIPRHRLFDVIPFSWGKAKFQRSFCVIILQSRAAILTIFPSSCSSKPHNKIRRCFSHASYSNFRFVPRISVSARIVACRAPSRCTTHTSFTVFFSGLTSCLQKYENVPVHDDSHVRFRDGRTLLVPLFLI